MACALAALLCSPPGCARGPTTDEAQGERVAHEEDGFSVAVPAGWTARRSRAGIALVRGTPYGGGYPTLTLRALEPEEAAALAFAGRRLARPDGELEYRYQTWSNARGRGYRLEAMLRLRGGVVLADASVWDPAQRMDEAFFEREFWPIVNSVRAAR